MNAAKAEAVFSSNKEMINAKEDDWIVNGIVGTRAMAKRLWNMCN